MKNTQQQSVALAITRAVGTMWCAALFALLALVSLPAALESGSAVVIVGWIAQTFLQLVLLSVIIAGQNIASDAAEARHNAQYAAGVAREERILAELRALQSYSHHGK